MTQLPHVTDAISRAFPVRVWGYMPNAHTGAPACAPEDRPEAKNVIEVKEVKEEAALYMRTAYTGYVPSAYTGIRRAWNSGGWEPKNVIEEEVKEEEATCGLRGVE